jgi:DNA mismatch repair protein MLH3
MSIRPLPEDVAEKIQSSILITELNGVVSGLVKNSLDAGATRINITLNYAKGNCEVDDDGSGILSAEFGEDGGLGKLHRKHLPPFRRYSSLHNIPANLC